MSNENHWINTHAHRDTHLLPHRDAFIERTKNSLKCSLEGCKVICTEGEKKQTGSGNTLVLMMFIYDLKRHLINHQMWY